MDNVILLSEPTNYAIVKLPTRQFAGVVFQGDSLNSHLNELMQILELISSEDADDAKEALELLIANLQLVKDKYEHVCRINSLKLPYMTAR